MLQGKSMNATWSSAVILRSLWLQSDGGGESELLRGLKGFKGAPPQQQRKGRPPPPAGKAKSASISARRRRAAARSASSRAGPPCPRIGRGRSDITPFPVGRACSSRLPWSRQVRRSGGQASWCRLAASQSRIPATVGAPLASALKHHKNLGLIRLTPTPTYKPSVVTLHQLSLQFQAQELGSGIQSHRGKLGASL